MVLSWTVNFGISNRELIKNEGERETVSMSNAVAFINFFSQAKFKHAAKIGSLSEYLY